MSARAGNLNAIKHGGDSAIEAISAGQELRGPARDAELQVYAELETTGRYSLVLKNAARLQAAADLYWQAIQGAAERQDLPALDKYIARFGWLAGASLRAWAMVKAEQADLEPSWIDALQAAKEAKE